MAGSRETRWPTGPSVGRERRSAAPARQAAAAGMRARPRKIVARGRNRAGAAMRPNCARFCHRRCPRLVVALASQPRWSRVAAASRMPRAPVKTEHVEAELVAERSALVPGEPLTVALRLTMDRGWHTYWRNPGDSGLPTTLEWKLPRRLSRRADRVAGAARAARRSARQLRLRRRGAAARDR